MGCVMYSVRKSGIETMIIKCFLPYETIREQTQVRIVYRECEGDSDDFCKCCGQFIECRTCFGSGYQWIDKKKLGPWDKLYDEIEAQEAEEFRQVLLLRQRYGVVPSHIHDYWSE